MKKFLNHPDTLLTESLSGFAAAHPDLVRLSLDPTYLARAHPTPGKVAVLSGGGSGHEPLHGGFVGHGMLDAACPGHVFTSPTPDQMLAALDAVDGGRGVLFLVKNYAGDVMNFAMAAEMLSAPNATVLISDDVAVEDSTWTTGRRGVAGTLIVEKIVGALAEAGSTLEDCRMAGEKANHATASMGIALTSCTVPAAGRPTFDLGGNEIEMGVGIHGEPGRRREILRPADDLVADLTSAILEDLKPGKGQDVLLLVNGFGATPLMELYLLHGVAVRLLERSGVRVVRSLVGNYVTALDMAGASLTVTLLDDQLLRLWDAPVHTAALRWGR